ncbi:glutathione S-transferase U7-like [Durio zibethinus]|uniref:glutathione transferase n=1 Tax=Durio zibethinus TaxID=66656 RepID=A0A6P5XVD0_DURZI|nr:glutathione S-transferase U7-like [Durio zibethinus]
MAEEVKLFGMWASSYNLRIELALKLKGMPYEYIEEDLSNKSNVLLQLNSVHEKIPVLVHNGKPIMESLVILEYIDETWKNNPLLPQDPYERATARFWAKFIDEKIQPTARNVNLAEGKEQEEAVEECCQQLKRLENELKGKSFFGSDTVGYLDIAALVIAFWFEVVREVVGLELVTEERFPILCKWIGKLQNIDAVNECAAVNECRPPKEEHFNNIRTRFEAAKADSK